MYATVYIQGAVTLDIKVNANMHNRNKLHTSGMLFELYEYIRELVTRSFTV